MTALDPEQVLALCRDFSGYDGVVKYLAESGLKNPKTGRPYTKAGVRYAAQRAAGYSAWRESREGARRDVAAEFKRIVEKRRGSKL